MTLCEAWEQLSEDLDFFTNQIRDFAAAKQSLSAASEFSVLDECLLEGILSRVWQAWGIFCRMCLIKSCMGTTNISGNNVNAITEAISEAHVSGAAICAKNQTAPPYWSRSNSLFRVEPTWGDMDILVKILTRLAPSNKSQLLAAFSSAYSSSKAMQVIRNGAAHNHTQNMAEINNLRSTYLVFPINHPPHAMFWVEPRSRDFLITHAMQELKDAGHAAAT